MVNYPYVYPLAAGGEEPTLIEITITSNGDYSAAQESPPADGYSEVHVAVPAPANKFKSLVDGSITSVTAADLQGSTEIRTYAFYGTIAITNVVIPSSIAIIGSSAFQNCSTITIVTFEDGLTTIGQYAFRGCSGLTAVSIPNSVTSIGFDTFRDCNGLTSIIIGTGITSIGDRAFRDCSNLQSIKIHATTPPAISSSTVFENTNNCPIYVPTPDDYKGATNWAALSSRIFPLVSTVADLANIDTTNYTKACVIGADNSYKEYAYDGTNWNEVV